MAGETLIELSDVFYALCGNAGESRSAPEREAAGLRYVDFIRLRTGDMKALCSTSQWLYP